MTNTPDENENIIHPDEEPEVIPPLGGGDRFVEKLPQPQPRMPSGGGDSGFDWFRVIGVSVVVSVVAIGILYFSGLVVPSSEYTKYQDEVLDLVTNMNTVIQELEVDLAQALTDIPNTITSKVDDGIGTVKTNISQLQSQVQDALNKVNSADTNYTTLSNTLTDIQNDLDILDDSITELNSQTANIITQSDLDTINQNISTLQTQIDAMEVELDKLIGDDNGGGTTTGELTVDIKQQTNYLAVSGNESIGIMRITMENNTNKDMEDIILGIEFQLPYNVSVDSLVITGGLQGWMPASPFNILYQRTSGWGYTLQADKEMVFDITAQFSNVGADIGQQYYEVEIYLESWSYK